MTRPFAVPAEVTPAAGPAVQLPVQRPLLLQRYPLLPRQLPVQAGLSCTRPSEPWTPPPGLGTWTAISRPAPFGRVEGSMMMWLGVFDPGVAVRLC